ncbi:MAG: peptide chain release factor N(5)-glutamine methyltransferase [Enterocloster sp.]
MTLQQLLTEGTERLKQAGVPDDALDARYLLLAVWDISLASFLAVRNKALPETEEELGRQARYEELIRQRAGRIPLQYLTGEQEFMGLSFSVNSSVLIPRQDTETLVELVLEEQKDRTLSILDMCTGSGCIAVSLARLGGYREVTALDISPEALKVAAGNAERLLAEYGGSFQLKESDMFEQLSADQKFDIIVSNPPYIPSEVIEGLEPEVKDHEPRLALDGRTDGLLFYRILAEQSGRYLKPGGFVYLEIGFDQAQEVERLFAEKGFTDFETVKDMAGLNRVFRAKKSC